MQSSIQDIALISLEATLTAAVASAQLAGSPYRGVLDRLVVLKRDLLRLRLALDPERRTSTRLEVLALAAK